MRLRWFGGSKHADVPEVERSAFHLAFTPTLGRSDRARVRAEPRQLLARRRAAPTCDVPRPDALCWRREADMPSLTTTSD